MNTAQTAAIVAEMVVVVAVAQHAKRVRIAGKKWKTNNPPILVKYFSGLK